MAVPEFGFFRSGFRALTDGFEPYPWQERLFGRLISGEVPAQCRIPTGLGKTCIIHAWLLGLAWQAKSGPPTIPRRLVYVVNRRTVVDQATAEAERLIDRLKHSDGPLAAIRAALGGLGTPGFSNQDGRAVVGISTLRGEFADNEAWKRDPARPAIVVGTVDMVGSRLLFSGYGDGVSRRSLHAGLLGHDVLLTLDETHLTPAFGRLLESVEALQSTRQEGVKPFRVMQLSATTRSATDAIELDEADQQDERVRTRAQAEKRLAVHRVATPGALQQALINRALAHLAQDRAVLVYVRTPREAARIAAELRRKAGDERVAVLTGTLRGAERDALAVSPVFRRLMRREGGIDGSCYLVSTSAGEVGVDLDADAGVFDLTTIDAFIQRAGRINRSGGRTAPIDLVAPEHVQDARLAATLSLLRELPEQSGSREISPVALGRLVEDPAYPDASAEPVRMRPLEPYLLDAWSLTGLQARPGHPVAPWLHGVTEREAPETWFVWRAGIPDDRWIARWLEAYPVVTRERARLSFASDLSPRRFLQDLRDAQAADANTALVILSVDGQGERVQLRELDGWRDRLAYATVILPPEVGGLALGIPDPEVAGRLVPDVADEPGRRERWHVAVTNGAWEATPIVDGLPVDVALILEGGSFAAAVASLEASRSLESLLVIPDTQDDEDIASGTVYLVSREPHLPDEQDLASVRATTQGLEEHLSRVGSAAEALARALHLSDGLASALRLAGELHDRGKARRWWQLAVGNTGPAPLAKCFGRTTNWALMGGYRHEFGSLLEVATLDQVTQHPLAELVLHLVAAHHGHARPGFAERAFDRGFSLDENRAAAREAALRFVRLQREYGWWTLAYLEALLKAADAMGSVETPQC